MFLYALGKRAGIIIGYSLFWSLSLNCLDSYHYSEITLILNVRVGSNLKCYRINLIALSFDILCLWSKIHNLVLCLVNFTFYYSVFLHLANFTSDLKIKLSWIEVIFCVDIIYKLIPYKWNSYHTLFATKFKKLMICKTIVYPSEYLYNKGAFILTLLSGSIRQMSDRKSL